MSPLASARRQLVYFDKLVPFISYRYDKQRETLYIGDVFDGLMRFITGRGSVFRAAEQDLTGVMKVRNFVFKSGYFGFQKSELAREGSLGMSFKDLSPLDLALAIVGPICDLMAVTYAATLKLKFISMADQILGLYSALQESAKSLRWMNGGDPLVIDLDRNGLVTTFLDGASTYYNLSGGDFSNRTGWLDGEDGFLVLDRNSNGRIDDISEMFGGRFSGGYEALSK